MISVGTHLAVQEPLGVSARTLRPQKTGGSREPLLNSIDCRDGYFLANCAIVAFGTFAEMLTCVPTKSTMS